MKKPQAKKLALSIESIQALKPVELEQVNGGYSTPGHVCQQPTTTVQHTFDC